MHSKGSLLRQYAGVLLISISGECILQRREKKEGIQNPGLLATFGGAVEAGESPLECAIRELKEELCISVVHEQLELLMEFNAQISRRVTIYVLRNVDPSCLSLQEGEAIEVIGATECLLRTDLSALCRSVVAFYAHNS